ncbi:MAG: hypothetical protein ACTSVI_11310 [Promethearchaeota archaeon]
MPTFGILESSNNILWYSSNEITRYMNLINFAISFASNLNDGRLEEIAHTPFLIHSQEVKNTEKNFLMIKSKEIIDKKEQIYINFAINFTESEIENHEHAHLLLDLFIEKFFDRIKISSKYLKKIQQKGNSALTESCDDIYKEIMLSYDLICSEDVKFLTSTQKSEKNMIKMLFSCISVQGLPIASNFYEDVRSYFRFKASNEENKEFVLENLISAQLSTLLFQSLIQGTVCNYILLKFTNFQTFEEEHLAINFFSLKEPSENHSFDKDDFYFITMCEGNPELGFIFQRSVTPLILQTGLLKQKFNGNVSQYKSLNSLLEQFPKELSID